LANYNSSHTGAEIDSAIGRVKDTAVTAGTVTASKGIVVDANKDISGFRNVTLTGQLQAATINLTGDTTIGDGDSDNITINADVNSNIIPNTDNTFDLGSASKQWKDLYVNGIGYIDQLGTDADPIAIYASSGEIDGTAIGSESASTGAFTTINASGNITGNLVGNVTGNVSGTAATVTGAAQSAITSVGTLTGLTVQGSNYTTLSIQAGTTSHGAILNLGDSGDIDYGSITQFGSGAGEGGRMRFKAGTTEVLNLYSNGNATFAGNLIANGNVGIGTTSPSSYDSYYDNLVVYENGNAGIAIIGSTSGETSLGFGDGTSADTYRGAVAYVHTSGDHQDKMFFKTASTNRMVIDSSGNVGIDYITPSSMNDSGNNLVIGSGASGDNTGLTIFSNSDSSGSIHFADGTSGDAAYRGIVAYTHSSDAMRFFTSGTEKARIASDGKVGIGTTSPGEALHVRGSAPKVKVQEDGTSHYVELEGGGSTAFINFYDSLRFREGTTERARISGNGNVLIGTTDDDARLMVKKVDGTSYGQFVTIEGDTTDNNNYPGIVFKGGTLANNYPNIGLTNGGLATSISGGYHSSNYNTRTNILLQGSDGSIQFATGSSGSSSERMRITSDGKIGIGVTSPSYKFQVVDSDNNGSVAFMQDNYDGTVNGTMDIVLGFKKSDGNFRNAAIIRAAKDDIYTSNTQADASLQFFTTLDGTSNKRMIITSQGYFLFQKEAPGFSTVGFEVDNGGRVGIKTNGTEALYVNRSQDGNLVEFASADTAEGTISVSGSTVSYNGFSGSHESSGIPTNTPIGTVVSTIDELDVYPDTDYKTGEAHSKAGETRTDHAKIKISDSVGDKRVYGVLASFNEDNKPIVASVGIGSVKVTGACEGGDLLESNGDGTAKIQDDDIIRNKTIGKVTIGDSDTGVKLVSCVLYCG
jgi:hypothetical protein